MDVGVGAGVGVAGIGDGSELPEEHPATSTSTSSDTKPKIDQRTGVNEGTVAEDLISEIASLVWCISIKDNYRQYAVVTAGHFVEVLRE